MCEACALSDNNVKLAPLPNSGQDLKFEVQGPIENNYADKIEKENSNEKLNANSPKSR